MLWFGKKKTGGPKTPKKPSRDELIAQAQANARKARAEIGEDTIRKVAESFVEEHRKKEQGSRQARIDRARNEIRAMDKRKVADHLRHMIDEDK